MVDFHRRGKLEIIHDILHVVAITPQKRTHIMYKTNTGHKQLVEYLDYLQLHNLIKKDGSYYEISKEGESVLWQIQQLDNSGHMLLISVHSPDYYKLLHRNKE